MAKLLLIGDAHVTVEELVDSQVLLDLVLKSANEHRPDRVVFLGDQHHSHALVRVEVLDFWTKNIQKLEEAGHKVLMLVGNHDRSHDVNLDSNTLKYGCTVIEKPTDLDGVRYIPWMADHDKFIAAAQNAPVVICHQTFDGAKYENGFYAKDGIDSKKIGAFLISGHIHTPAKFGNVWYPGAPRWRILTDANTERAIHLLDLSKAMTSIAIPTDACSILRFIEDREGIGAEAPNSKPSDRTIVAIHGSQEYITSRKSVWSACGARVTTFVTQTANAKVKESDGVHIALQKHVEAFKSPNNTPREVLIKMVQERIHV